MTTVALDAEHREAIQAVNRALAATGRRFLTVPQILDVLKGLGYRRRKVSAQSDPRVWSDEAVSILRATYPDGAVAAQKALAESGFLYTVCAVQVAACRRGLHVRKSKLFRELYERGISVPPNRWRNRHVNEM